MGERNESETNKRKFPTLLYVAHVSQQSAVRFRHTYTHTHTRKREKRLYRVCYNSVYTTGQLTRIKTTRVCSSSKPGQQQHSLIDQHAGHKSEAFFPPTLYYTSGGQQQWLFVCVQTKMSGK
jgi:hypothetical protein